MPLRIILADDHPIVSSGVRLLLERCSFSTIVAEAASPDELLKVLATWPCDVLVTDFNMPGDSADGLILLQQVGRRWPSVAIVVLTQLGNPSVLNSILQTAGVRGLVSKNDAMQELPSAVTAASQGRTYISGTFKKVFANAQVDTQPEANPLSRREAEVMRLFVAGHTVSDIARQLNRSVKTVSSQKMEAMRKLGVKSDLELYQYAREHGLRF